MEEARLHQQRKRLDGKEGFDVIKSFQTFIILKDNIILLHNAI